jgi:hypothetical protein
LNGTTIIKIVSKPNMTQNQSIVDNALNYAESLLGLPFRWYDSDVDSFIGTDKFWCANEAAPTAKDMVENDVSICCAGFPNLLRRCQGFCVPGLEGSIRGKHSEYYKQFPGGTGAWFLYLYQNNRLQKFDRKKRYPRGTLLIARFKDNEKDQGHLAVVYDDVEEGKTIREQQIIHSVPTIDYKERHEHKNHGSIVVESFLVSDDKFKWDRYSYYKWVCLPEDWLLVN